MCLAWVAFLSRNVSLGLPFTSNHSLSSECHSCDKDSLVAYWEAWYKRKSVSKANCLLKDLALIFSLSQLSSLSLGRPMIGLWMDYWSDDFLIGGWLRESGDGEDQPSAHVWPKPNYSPEGSVMKDNALAAWPLFIWHTFSELKGLFHFEIFMALKVKAIPFWSFTSHDD